MKFFDSHLHFFPDALAPKTLPKLSEICGCPYYSDGSRRNTLEKLKGWGCDGGMALHIATTEHQESSVNRFAVESQGNGIYCFGSVFPGAADYKEQLEFVKSSGLYGIKLHPDYQGFFIDEDRACHVYEEAQRLGLPIAFHTGFDPVSPTVAHCPPDRLAKIAREFPGLTIIAAHMGGMDMAEDAAKYLAGRENVYFDTAFASHFLTAPQLRELIQLHGADRVLFATDCPWSTFPDEKNLLLGAGLSAVELEKIAFRNAEALFGITL